MKTFASGVSIVVLSTLIGEAHAQPEPSEHAATARELFRRALVLMAEGHHARACPMLEESQRLDGGMGTQYRLAECYEHTKRPASARALFMKVAATAANAGNVEREQRASARAKALEPIVPRIALKISPAGEPKYITIDGREIPKARWGEGEEIDVGTHEINANLSDGSTWATKVDVEGGQQIDVQIPARPPPPHHEPSSPPANELHPPFVQRYSVSFILGGAALAIGTVGGGVGAWTYAHHRSFIFRCHASLSGCGQDDWSSLRREAAATTALFVVAGATLVAAVTYGLVKGLWPPKAALKAPSATGWLLRF